MMHATVNEHMNISWLLKHYHFSGQIGLHARCRSITASANLIFLPIKLVLVLNHARRRSIYEGRVYFITESVHRRVRTNTKVSVSKMSPLTYVM